MRRNYGVFAASDLLPVVFKNGQNLFFFIQIGHLSLYRSLGEGREEED